MVDSPVPIAIQLKRLSDVYAEADAVHCASPPVADPRELARALEQLRARATALFDTAYEIVYEDTYGKVYGFFYKRTWQPADVEDWTQTVFVNVRTGLLRMVADGIRTPGRDAPAVQELRSQTCSPGYLQAYLWRSVRNYYTGRVRARRHSDSLEALLAVGDDVTDPAASPEEVAIMNALLRDLVPCWGRLTEKERTYLSLRIRGYDYGSIAARCGVSVGSVKRQVFEAIAKLRRCLGVDSKKGVR